MRFSLSQVLIVVVLLCLSTASVAQSQSRKVGQDTAATVALACIEHLTKTGKGLSRLESAGLRRRGKSYTRRVTLENTKAQLFVVIGRETCRYTVTTFSERRPTNLTKENFERYLEVIDSLASSYTEKDGEYLFQIDGKTVWFSGSTLTETRGSHHRYSATFMARLWR